MSLARNPIIIAMVMAFVILSAPFTPTALAAVYAVNSTADTDDGVCDLAPDCTLREAWNLANGAAGPHTIDLSGVAGTITLGSALAATLQDITLTGPGASALTVDANTTNRAFDGIDTVVGMSGLTITNGASGGLNGGCILVGAAGTLTVDASTITACDAGIADGGGIYSTGDTTITNTTISANTAANGAGVWLSGSASVSAATITGNTATTAGGGAFLSAVTGTGTLTNVTVSANDAPAGAGINLDAAGVGDWGIMASTIANNLTGDGFTENAAITATIQNTIMTGNAGNDCTGTGINTDGGGNVIVAGACAGITPVSTVDPALAALADYSGPVQTHGITTGSSAIDIGIAAGAPATDARGAARPVDGDASTTAEHDAGAFEYGPLSAVSDTDPVNYGNVVVSVTTGATTLTITNDGNQVWTTPSLQLTNTTDFSISAETCTAGPIPLGGTCTIDITATPSTTGGLTGAVEMSNDAGATWLTLAGLNVTGIAGSVGFTPAIDPHDFGTVDLAGSSAQTFTITNAGGAILNITTVAVGGVNAADFVKSADTCTGAAVAASGGTCTFDITFTPGATGARTATITVTSDAPSSPDTLGLTGTGAEPLSTVTPASPYAFGPVATGSLQQVTISVTPGNTLPLDVTGITLTNTSGTAFSMGAPSCGALPQTITAPTTCDAVVTLDTAAAGTFGADVTVTTSDPNNSPQTVALTATVTATAPIPGFSPTTWSPTTPVSTPTSQTFTLSNDAGASGNLTTIALSLSGTGAAAYATAADTCTGATLTPGQSCTFDVTFTPASAAVFAATLSVTSNGTTQTATLSGTGTATSALPGLSPTTWAPAATVGTPMSQVFTLTNGAGATADLNTIAVALSGTGAAEYAVSADTCTGATLTPGQTCTFSVTYDPAAAGTHAATVTVTSNATAQTATISGTATVSAGPPSATVSRAAIDFGNASVGNSIPRGFSVVNDSSAVGNLTVSAITVTGSTEYRIDNETCTAAALAPGEVCDVTVTYTPTTTAASTGTVSITSNDAASPHSVSLTGTGITGPSLTLTPTTVDFGTTMVGDTEAITVTVGVSGTGTVTGITPLVTGTGFTSLADACAGASLTSADICSVIVGFTPSATGSATGSLTVSATNATAASAPITANGIEQVTDNGTTTDNTTTSDNTTDNRTLIGGTDETTSIGGATGCSATPGASTGAPILALICLGAVFVRMFRTPEPHREESA